MNKVLKKLGLEEFNYGASSSYNNCIKNEEQKPISSYNPSDGTLLSSVYKSSIADLDKIIKRSFDAFNEFKKIPAPVRGDLVREMSTALRDYKDDLGTLVSLEMGKIKQEGSFVSLKEIPGFFSETFYKQTYQCCNVYLKKL